MVEPRDPAARRAWREILETLFTPDDAALASRLPVVPTAIADLARRTGIGAGDLRAQLEAMAGKGLVLDLHDPRTGATTYMLAPPVVGFFELSMMRLNDGLPKERLARAYEAYVADDRAFDQAVSGVPTLISRTLVQETALYDELASEVLDWERATSYVENADSLAVTNCFCRHVATHLGAACDYLGALGGGAGMAAVAAHEHHLTGLALEQLGEIPGVRIIGPATTEARGGAVSFVVDGIHPHDVGQVLDDRGVEVRVGHHCAWPLTRRYGVPATTRASFYLYNDDADVAALVSAVRHAQTFFQVA